MPSTTTLLEVRTDVRSRLDETNAASGYFTDTELNRWINEAQRDIARRAEVLQSFNTSVNAVVGTAKYNLPSDVIRVHRIEFVPTGSTQVYPLESRTYDELDQYWGVNPTTQRSYPSYYAIWGVPGGTSLQVQFYPVPSNTGVFNIYYYRLPGALTADGNTLDIPEGWQDLVALYCEYVAKRKLRDSTWSEAKQLYDESLENLVAVSRDYTDSPRSLIYRGSAVPQWLYEFDY